MQEQTVIKVGNSLAVTLPRHFVKGRKVKAGQRVFVDADTNVDVVQIRTKRNSVSSLTPEFKQWLDEMTEKYADVMRELAKR